MARKMIRSHWPLPTSSRHSNHVWYLATNTDVVRFYVFKSPESLDAPIPDGYTLIETFDRGKLPGAADKKTAASWAKRLGLGTWIDVRV